MADHARLHGHRRATLADVASAAGVSPATASRALAGGPHVSARARERVWAAADRLQFQPNHLARSLRRGSTHAVGVVVPDVAVAFYACALKGAQETLEAAGYHALVVNTERAADRERTALRTLRAHQVDGLLVATSGGFQDIGVPAVFFDNLPARLGAGAIALENEEGVALLVEHLAHEHGHERIAYVGGPERIAGADGSLRLTGLERLEGFRAAVGRAGLALPPEYVRTTDPACSESVARAIAVELAALERPPTAIVAGSDSLALGVLEGLRDRGRRVPEDVALVSFDEPRYAELLDPPLTALDRHDAELGRRAAELLLRALGPGEPPEPAGLVRVALALHRRHSCGCGA